MAVYEEKFIVINRKHLNKMPDHIQKKFNDVMHQMQDYLDYNKYYVVNRDEPYAQKVIDLIINEETEKEKRCENCGTDDGYDCGECIRNIDAHKDLLVDHWVERG